MKPSEAEKVIVGHDRESGLDAVIAIDDTTLGPALGGVRLRAYSSLGAARTECLRLARAMTLKNALADVGFGGGKAVIIQTPQMLARRQEALLAFGRCVSRAGGSYVAAADMGTSVEDLEIIARTAPRLVCADVDTSLPTAHGVHAAIAQAVRAVDIASSLDGVSVLVQGVGHVGSRLAHLLAASGTRLCVCDADRSQANAVARRVGAKAVNAKDALRVDVDVLVPCAVAKVINPATVDALACRVVVGAANDQLSDAAIADRLAERSIAYVPDFLASAGGVIHVRAVRDGWSSGDLRRALVAIGERARDVLEQARVTGRTPVAIAEEAAYARLLRASASTSTGATRS